MVPVCLLQQMKSYFLTLLIASYIIAVVCYLLYTRSVDNDAFTITGLNPSSSIFDTCPLVLHNHLDPELLPFYHPTYNPKANCSVYEPLTELVKAQVLLNEKAKGYKCQARCLLHKRTDSYVAETWIELPSKSLFKCDIVETKCIKNNTIEAFLHTQIFENKDARKISKPDVYVFIIDSVSSGMAKRSLPKTLEYLKNIGGVQIEFLNRVGSNSKTNGFPLAFGKSLEGGNRDMVGLPPLVPDWDNDKICGEYLDQYSYYLWEYAKRGYKTMIANDYSADMVFYPNCLGFNKVAADHIWRPFDIRRQESANLKKSFNDSCSESHLEILDYLGKFMKAYPGTPKIAQAWPAMLAHETLKDLFHTDEHFLEFFKKNRMMIERSFFFFMSDHGPRREGISTTHLGRYEGNNPFLVVLIPSAYHNTSIHHQLRRKTYELMTNFDLHATLMDIVMFQPENGFSDTSYRSFVPLSKGSSLFREWRGVRNCRTLPIPSQFCICQYKKTNVTYGVLKRRLGNFFAKQLNQLLINSGLADKCQMQFYNSTSSVKQIQDAGSTLYDVVVRLTPSGGLFSAHIRSNAAGLMLSSAFSRLDRYGRQGDCLDNRPLLKPLCHCKGTTVP